MRWLRHCCSGISPRDLLNWCQSKIRFGVTRLGSGRRVEVPDGDSQGQVREREGGHDGDRINAGGDQGKVSDRQGNDQEGQFPYGGDLGEPTEEGREVLEC